MAECYRFTVSGRVQGVFFRQSTVDQARALGLDGWVRNRADGAVEGVTAGAPEALQRLRDWLAHGPPAAQVVKLEWVTETERPEEGFRVRR